MEAEQYPDWYCRFATTKLFENKKIPDHTLYQAELYRNLGEFETAIHTLNKISEKLRGVLYKIILAECHKKNRWVVKL